MVVTVGGHADGDASIAIGSGWADSAYARLSFPSQLVTMLMLLVKQLSLLGRQSKTNGEEASIAIGNETEAIAKDSTAVGSGSKSSGEYAAALGFQTKATANYATAIGSGARGYAEDSQLLAVKLKHQLVHIVLSPLVRYQNLLGIMQHL